MNEKKVKFAFAKVRDDIKSLRTQLENIEKGFEQNRKNFELSNEVKKQIEDIKKFDLERFVKNMEGEFSSINKLLKEFNLRFQESSSLIEKFSKQVEMYNNELKEFKKRILKTQDRAENTNLDLESLNNRFEEFQELINEKISLEINQLRLELTDEIASIYDRVFNEINKLKKEKVKSNK